MGKLRANDAAATGIAPAEAAEVEVRSAIGGLETAAARRTGHGRALTIADRERSARVVVGRMDHHALRVLAGLRPRFPEPTARDRCRSAARGWRAGCGPVATGAVASWVSLPVTACCDTVAVTGPWSAGAMEPRSWTAPLAPALLPPDTFLHLRLRLTDAWLETDGEWLALAEASTAALWSILGYLRWHAPLLMRRDPEAARFAVADSYLASRPLVDAIDAELATRGEIARGEALACLAAIGVAPWELPATSAARSRRSRG